MRQMKCKDMSNFNRLHDVLKKRTTNYEKDYGKCPNACNYTKEVVVAVPKRLFRLFEPSLDLEALLPTHNDHLNLPVNHSTLKCKNLRTISQLLRLRLGPLGSSKFLPILSGIHNIFQSRYRSHPIF